MKQKHLLFGLAFLGFCNTTMARQYHVFPSGADCNKGTLEAPFRTISRAARQAIAGDSVLIHAGTYREWVSPFNGGLDEVNNIVYMAAPDENVYLKGSEIVSNWKSQKKGVWKAEIDNEIFGDFNPFAETIHGDFNYKKASMGAVYMDNERLMNVDSLYKVAENELTWFAEVEADKTVVYANFGKKNPKKGLVEVNARPTCFFPKYTGVNYIKVKGLHISQASPQWAPPTALQMGLIGPHWSKGWVIEDCEVSHSRCAGISLGKENASGNNITSTYSHIASYIKTGFSREIEAILKATALGWNKDNIGSHVVQRNYIHDCGQVGIVGHLGAINSVIRDNRIDNINVSKDDPMGAETGGIKLHAAIDAIIDHNYITNTRRGIWLDWQTQGVHLCNNVINRSRTQDLFIEVSHGPSLIYNNLFLSPFNIYLDSQGLAFFNNLFNGYIEVRQSPIRYTPYHEAHSTAMKGLYNNNGGDNRFYNNVFLCNHEKAGLKCIDDYITIDQFTKKYVQSAKNYLSIKAPVWTDGNAYYGDKGMYKYEKGYTNLPQNEKISVEVTEDANHIWHVNVKGNTAKLQGLKTVKVDTKMLGKTIISEAYFDYPDASPFVLDKDFLGKERNSDNPTVGPIEY